MASAIGKSIDADFVLRFRFDSACGAKSEAQFEKLVDSLYTAGLSVESRDGDNGSILLFAKIASERNLFKAVYHSRVKDWLYGVCQTAPVKDPQGRLNRASLTEAERLRIVYLLITNPCSEGGAGITPNEGDWQEVDAVFPLHDHVFNKEWLKHWSTRYFLSIDDLTKIRDHYGEKIAFYFAFLQSYFSFLLFPAGIGTLAYFVFPSFSTTFAIISCFWSVIFVEYWILREVDLAVLWGVRGVSSIQQARPEFKPEKEATDPVTRETLKIFPAYKRLGRQALQIPFALVASAILGALIAVCFSIEIFISEIYDGPFKTILGYIPIGLLATLEPTLTAILTRVATKLTDYENYQTADSYEAAMVQKVFVFNLITAYLPIFLTAFAYIPFGHLIAPYLDILRLGVRLFADDPSKLTEREMAFRIDPARLRREVIHFGVTAQIIDQLFEVVVPYLKNEWFRRMKDMRSEHATKNGTGKSGLCVNDPPEEALFLATVRNEADLDEYDVNVDLREMCMQFGYLTTFSVVWPLTPLCFLVNNWIELRSDAVKICFEMRRPVPLRSDTIGPWLENLGFLTWLGSVTSAALVFLFSGDEPGVETSLQRINSWGFLLCIILSEQLYFSIRFLVRYGVSQLESRGLRQERRAQFLARKRYLEETLGGEAPEEFSGTTESTTPQIVTDGMDCKSLDETPRASGALLDASVINGVLGRRRDRQKSVSVGVGIIRQGLLTKKSQ